MNCLCSRGHRASDFNYKGYEFESHHGYFNFFSSLFQVPKFFEHFFRLEIDILANFRYFQCLEYIRYIFKQVSTIVVKLDVVA